MGSESLKDQEKRDLFFSGKEKKNLVENKQDLFFPSVLQGKKFTIKLSNRQVVFTIQRGKNCLDSQLDINAITPTITVKHR